MNYRIHIMNTETDKAYCGVNPKNNYVIKNPIITKTSSKKTWVSLGHCIKCAKAFVKGIKNDTRNKNNRRL